MTMYQYLQQVGAAMADKDGQALAELLSIKHSHALSPRLQVEDSEAAVERELQSAFDDVVVAHTRCLWAISEKNFCEAYACQTGMVQVFTKVFQSQKDENWALPVMRTLCLDLHTLAVGAERQSSQQGKGNAGEMLEKAADLLMALFRVCASDNRTLPEDSKRKGMLHLVNQLFKIYFRINKLHLCKPLVRAIDSSNIKDQFGIAQLVTYKYYVGRKAMFDSDFANAEEFLTFAFERCYKKSRKNKRLILVYLIPVKMILGKLPQRQLLKKYDLLQFEDVVKAVREGNLQKLAAAMSDNESFFIHCGIYLILEKLKIIAYRNLFKKVHLLLKTHQIPIDAFLVALKYMGEDDVDLDEVECILGNLIYEGKVKGYISHQHRKLVVSKQNPFPPLSTVL